jgi:N6-L-threonylcarbamoyladenine synthase
MNKTIITLGIETSCDETGAAVYHSERGILSNAIFSQTDLHRLFGGVIPELASRSQLEKITPIVHAGLQSAHLDFDMIDVVAVTNKPGLPGSLLVGVCFAKIIAWAKQKKLIGVNHLEGHAFSAFLEHDVPFEHICLTASGGHTSLYRMKDFGDYEVLGATADDAAGEAFDKIAKLLELPYPGGPVIERLAREVAFEDFFHYPRHNPHTLNFSFSGLKTAVLYDLVKRNAYDMHTKTLINKDEMLKKQVSSSLLVCIADIFEQKLALAVKQYPMIKAISFVGGVACNKYIRNRLQNFCNNKNLSFYVPSAQYCTDNAAMIAFVGNYKAQRGEFSDWSLDILK